MHVTDVPFNIKKIITRCLEVRPKNRITLVNILRLAAKPDAEPRTLGFAAIPSIPTTVSSINFSTEPQSLLCFEESSDPEK